MSVPASRPLHDSRYDAALERLHAYGPERSNGFTSHGPMAVEALVMLGRSDEVEAFARSYATLLGPARPLGKPIEPEAQRSALGKAMLYPMWHATFRKELAEAKPREVITKWAPILLPGCLAAAFHGVLMTTHALRGLESGETPVRIEGLARGLAYWAATHQPLPGEPSHSATGEPLADLLAAVPPGEGPRPVAIDATVHMRTHGDEEFARLTSRPRAVESDPIATLTTAGARTLLTHPDGTIIFIHAVTGPVAFRHLARWIDAATFERSIDYLWQAVAGVLVTFTRAVSPEEVEIAESSAPPIDREQLIEAAVATGDEHAIKVVEAALVEKEATGSDLAMRAAGAACNTIANAD